MAGPLSYQWSNSHRFSCLALTSMGSFTNILVALSLPAQVMINSIWNVFFKESSESDFDRDSQRVAPSEQARCRAVLPPESRDSNWYSKWEIWTNIFWQYLIKSSFDNIWHNYLLSIFDIIIFSQCCMRMLCVKVSWLRMYFENVVWGCWMRKFWNI